MNDFSKLKILVIGDVMLDRYWYGDCTRISPEAPVPVVNVSGIDDRLGGAANAALNLSTIGCEVSLYGLIGDDEAGRSIETLLSGASVRNFCGALLDNTILKLRVLTNSQQAIRLDFEKSIDDRIALNFASSEFLAELIADNDLILLSDYLKGSLKYADKIINLCKSSVIAAQNLSQTKNSDRNKALRLIAKKILKNTDIILRQNRKDINIAKKNNLSRPLIDRLYLDKNRVFNLSKDILNIVKLENPIGKILSTTVRPNGLKISKITVPLGLIAVIFESRPNVASDVAALCIKSGNAVILKGGKEAKFTLSLIHI